MKLELIMCPHDAALDPLFNGAYSDAGGSDAGEDSSEQEAPIIVVSNRLPFVLKRQPDDGSLFRKARSVGQGYMAQICRDTQRTL